MFFNAVVQAVLLFGSETWVLTSRMDWALGSLHHRVAQRLTGRQPRQRGKRRWYYPTLVSVMEEAGFGEIGVNITRRKNAVAQYIATRPILDLCERSGQRPGDWVSWRWWEHEGIDIEGDMDRAVADSDREEENFREGAAQEETTVRIWRQVVLR